MRTISDVWFMLTLSPDIVFSLLFALLLISLETTILVVIFVSASKSKVYCAELGIATWIEPYNIQGSAMHTTYLW